MIFCVGKNEDLVLLGAKKCMRPKLAPTSINLFNFLRGLERVSPNRRLTFDELFDSTRLPSQAASSSGRLTVINQQLKTTCVLQLPFSTFSIPTWPVATQRRSIAIAISSLS